MPRVVGKTAMVVLLCLGLGTPAAAQQPPVHYWHQGAMPPGAIGSLQLQRGGPLPGYFQPVKIKAPDGALISLAEAGTFGPAQQGPVTVGMLIGPVYRIRVTNIPSEYGREVFPTVEVINRLYAPPGTETRFPIEVELTLVELQLALSGKFVTRVIYLEDPQRALPIRQGAQGTNWFEAGPNHDPLAIADQLGRPVAILRLGGRLPDAEGPSIDFLYGCPPVVAVAAPQSPQEPSAAEPTQASRSGLWR